MNKPNVDVSRVVNDILNRAFENQATEIQMFDSKNEATVQIMVGNDILILDSNKPNVMTHEQFAELCEYVLDRAEMLRPWWKFWGKPYPEGSFTHIYNGPHKCLVYYDETGSKRFLTIKTR